MFFFWVFWFQYVRACYDIFYWVHWPRWNNQVADGGNKGRILRTKRSMAAGSTVFCDTALVSASWDPAVRVSISEKIHYASKFSWSYVCMPTQFHWPLHGNIQTQRCIECATNPQSNLPPHSSGNCPNLRSIGLWKVTCTAFHLDDSCVVVVQNTSLAIYFVNHHVLKCVNVNSAIKCNSANISIVSHDCEMAVELTFSLSNIHLHAP